MLKLVSFNGRTSRLGYWRAYLASTVLLAVCWSLGLFAIMNFGPIGGVLFVGIPVSVLVMWATSLRRLHDRGKNVWWLAMFTVAPFLCAGVANLLVSREATTLASLPFLLAALGLNIWGLVEMGFRRGDSRANRYGDVPAVGR